MGELLGKNPQENEKKPEVLDMKVVKRAVVLGFDIDGYALRENLSYMDIGEGGIEKAAEIASKDGLNYALVPFEAVRGEVKVGEEKIVVESKPPEINKYRPTTIEQGLVFLNTTLMNEDIAKKADPNTVFNYPSENGKYVRIAHRGVLPFREGKDRIINTPKKAK